MKTDKHLLIGFLESGNFRLPHDGSEIFEYALSAIVNFNYAVQNRFF